jgi:hypothetical protein
VLSWPARRLPTHGDVINPIIRRGRAVLLNCWGGVLTSVDKEPAPAFGAAFTNRISQEMDGCVVPEGAHTGYDCCRGAVRGPWAGAAAQEGMKAGIKLVAAEGAGGAVALAKEM